MRYLLLFLLSLLSVNSLSAETIKGRIVDEQNQPMPYANVVPVSYTHLDVYKRQE